MDYEKKYIEAVKQIKNLFNDGEQKGFTIITYRKDFEKIFPELKESEDEKIKNCIGMCLAAADEQWFKDYNTTLKNCLDWLEKQGEQEPTDKVESKFHEGDWVVKGDTIAQILDIQEQYYVGLDINGKDFTSSRFLNDDKIHHWTVQDAKDGDVLACENEWTNAFYLGLICKDRVTEEQLKKIKEKEKEIEWELFSGNYDRNRVISEILWKTYNHDRELIEKIKAVLPSEDNPYHDEIMDFLKEINTEEENDGNGN